MSHWTHILTAQEIEARFDLTAKLDRRFAEAERDFWSTRTEPQLRVLALQAWNANDGDQYQKARSWQRLKGYQVSAH